MVSTHSGGGPSALCSLWTSSPIISSRNILTGFCLQSGYPVSDNMVHKITYSHLCVSTLCTLQFPLSVYKLLSAGFICLYHAPVLTVNSSEQGDRGVEDKTMNRLYGLLEGCSGKFVSNGIFYVGPVQNKFIFFYLNIRCNYIFLKEDQSFLSPEVWVFLCFCFEMSSHVSQAVFELDM